MRVALAFLLFVALPVLAQDRVSRIGALLDQYADRTGFSGTIITAENGTVVFARGYGFADREKNLQNGPQVHYRIASITKTFTSALIMKLVEAGKIRLQDPICVYLPDYRKETGDKVTIHHLLSHTSGIPNYVLAPDFPTQAVQPPPPLKDLVRDRCSGDLQFEPGARFSYSNSGFVILGAIIEQVTGMPYERALKTMLLEPAGMSESGLDHDDLNLPQRALGYAPAFGNDAPPALPWKIDWAFSAGAIYSTPEDMVRWDQALYNEQVLQRKSISMMASPTTRNAANGTSYGYGFMLHRKVRMKSGDSALVMAHSGGFPGFTSLFSRVPATRQMVFVVSNHSDPSLTAITQGVFDILNGLDPAPVRKSVALELYRGIAGSGLSAGLRAVESGRAAAPQDYAASEEEINLLGYQYLREKKLPEAEAIFALNIREFPGSWNVYDSMGECYALMGNKERAIKFYQKSVEMNPSNTGAVEALKALGASGK